MLARGWHRNKDRKSAIFHLKYVILETESSMMENLQPWQLVNHFLKNNLIVTKCGLCNSLKNLIWWSTLPANDFVPRTYDLTEKKELEEFKEDYRLTKAEIVLKKYLKRRHWSCAEKLLIAIDITEKRLRDINDELDVVEEHRDKDGEMLEGLVPDCVWQYIK